jgi:hypothetical protein
VPKRPLSIDPRIGALTRLDEPLMHGDLPGK